MFKNQITEESHDFWTQTTIFKMNFYEFFKLTLGFENWSLLNLKSQILI